MFRKFFDWLSSETQTRSRKFRDRQLRRDRFQREMWRQCRVEPLEDRRLLAVFSNLGEIVINDDAVATPYPSTITLPASVTATALEVNVTLFSVSHTEISDINVLLTAPAGGNVELMRFAGTGAIANETWTFDDGAPAMPFVGDPGSGTFSPTQFGVAVAYPAPAPAGPYGTTMAAVAGGNVVGDWGLFVLDNAALDVGTIAGGWSLDIQFGGAVVINAGADADDAVADTFLVQLSGANLMVDVNGSTVFDEPFAGVTSLTINGSDDADTLTVDFSGGNPLPAGGFTFAGGDGFDTLQVLGGNFTTITNNFANANDGSIVLNQAGPVSRTIDYTGLSPVLLNVGTVADIEFNLPAVANPDVLLADDTAANFPGNGLGIANTSAIDGSTFEYTSFTNPTNSLTVNMGGGNDILSLVPLDALWPAAAINLNGQGGIDQIQIAATPANTIVNVDTGAGVPGDLLIVGATVAGGGSVPTTFAQFNTGISTLDFLGAGSIINFDDGGGVGELYVDDSGDVDPDVVTFTSSSITGASPATINYVGANVNIVQLALGSGSDTINLNSTGADDFSGGTTTIFGNNGNDTFNIAANTLSGRNVFNGNAGNDTFTLNFPAGTTVGQNAVGYSPFISLQINGNDPANDPANRDTVNINTNAAGDGVRNVTIAYVSTASGDIDVAGLGGTIDLNGIETLDYNGDAVNNDVVTVIGTAAGNDLITVAPLNSNRALVFNNSPGDTSGPFNGPPEDFSTRIPGVSGGSVRPDLDLSGLANLTGLTVTDPGPGTGDRLYVYGESTAGLNDGNAFDPFGFGAGQILPAVGEPAAFDVITVTDTRTQVESHVAVNYNTTDFAQSDPTMQPAVVINTGDEGNPPATPGTDAADVINLTVSGNYRFQVNGGDPDPSTTGIVPPDGDQLVVATVGDLDVFSDKAFPPNVSVVDSSGSLPFGFSSIENLVLDAQGGTVNLLGDNNFTNAQTDNFVVRGTGPNAFTLEINGSAPIQFINVVYLNVSGGEEIDTLDITAWADNTPQGWGIQVTYDEGAPDQADGAQQDLLIYNTVAAHPVSEDIVIQPSGPENGELRVTNAADGSVIVVISYINNLDIVVNDNDGYLSDTDALVLRGTSPGSPQTSGDDVFLVDFTNAGTVAEPIVTVSDANNAVNPLLYRLRDFIGFGTLTIELLDGDDQITVRGASSGESPDKIATLNIFGGTGDDTLVLDNTGGLSTFANGLFYDGGPGNDQLQLIGDTTVDSSVYTVGPRADEGFVLHTLGVDQQRVYFSGLEPVVDLVAAATLTVNATHADNAINYDQSPTMATWGRVTVDEFESIEFANKTELVINALAGSDVVNLNNPTTPTGLTGITVNGGDPTGGSDTVIANGSLGVEDAIRVELVDHDTATVDITIDPSGANVALPTVTVHEAEKLIINGQGGDDALTIAGADDEPVDYLHTPGAATDAGRVDADRDDAAPEPFIPVEYLGLGDGSLTLELNGNADLTVLGTDLNDVLVVQELVGDQARITHTVDPFLGFVRIPIIADNIGTFTAVIVDGLAGDDNITWQLGPENEPILFVTARGGGGNDVFTIVGEAGVDDAITIQPGLTPDRGGYTIARGGFAIASGDGFSGIELVRVQGNGGDVDTLTVRGTTLSDEIELIAGGSGNTDRIQGSFQVPVDAIGPFDTITVDLAAGDGANDVLTVDLTELSAATNYVVLGNAAAVASDQLVLLGTNDNDDANVILAGTTVEATIDRDPGTAGDVNTIRFEAAQIGQLTINTLGGDDVLTVDNSGGLIVNPIVFNGGGGFDELRLVGTTAVDSATYTPGATNDGGTVVHDLGGVSQTIAFTGLEPVIDLVPATTLVVNGTNADNAINYDQSPTVATWGRVTVDEFESIEFANKTELVINALAGSDTINLNNPTTPTNLTGITVNAGDPTSSDRLVVNGRVGVADILRHNPTGQGAGNVVNDAVGQPSVDFTGIERLHLVVQQADGDEVRLEGTIGDDRFEFFHGATGDSGTFRGTMDANNATGAGPFTLTETTYFGVSGAANDVDVNFFNPGGVDAFAFNGTAADDIIDIAIGDGGGTEVRNTIDGAIVARIELFNMASLVARGHDGDDTFNVAGDHPIISGVEVQGGNPSGSDVLNFAGGGGAVAVNLEARTVTEVNPVAYSGIETINVDAAGAVLTVVATSEDDDLTVTVFSATTGRVELGPAVQKLGEVQRGSVPPVVNYADISGALSVDLGGGVDTLIVVGNAFSQTFNVNASGAPFAIPGYGLLPANTVQIDDLNDLTLDGAVTYLNHESLQVYGLEGNDTFNVVAGGIPVFVDGGDPIGTIPGDAINVFGATGFFPGPEPDEGGFLTPGETISFDHIEVIGFIVPDPDCPFLIVGTNGDDDITVIARDDSTHPGADGQQDFTFSVNGSGEILVLNQPDLYIDALSGDDDIVIRTRAPNGANWGVHVRVVGGAPSAVTGDQGDVLQIETPFGSNDSVIYTPTGSDTGTLLIDENGNQTHDAGIDTLIEILAFIPDLICPPVEGEVLHVFSRGGVEQLIYEGEGAGDSLTVNGTAGDDTIVHTPHAGIDEGHVRVNTLLGISYQNLGAGSSLTIDGGDDDDTLVVDGTGLSDSFTVAAATGTVTLANSHGTRLAVAQANVEHLALNGLEGDDTFTINAPQPYASITANGGGPGASDVLVINGAAGVDEAFTVTPDFGNGDGTVTVIALVIPYTGIEHLLLDANGGDTDTLTVNDDFADNLWTVAAGPIFGDRVQIDGRESIDYVAFDAVTLVNQFGADHFVIHPTHLVGSAALTVIADTGVVRDDVVTIIGTEADDVVTATTDTVTVNAPAGVPVTIGGNGDGFAELRIITLGGDDVIGHDGLGGNPPALALALSGVRKFVDAGAGNDIVNMSLTQDAVIFGGDGDDLIVGTPLADFIDGGRGDDTISGLAGDDVIYGGEGNDTIIGGPGFDRMFGGDGSDTFIWNPGDGSDLVEGGGDEADVLVFNGSDAAEIFHIFAALGDPSRAILFRSVGNLTIDMAGIEQIQLNTLGGADTVNVGRSQAALGSQLSTLTTTDVKVVNLDLAAAAGGPDAAADTVVFEGRALDDNLFVSVSNNVLQVAGLAYSLFLHNSSPADSDLLDVRGNDGNDRITVAPGVSGVIGVRLFGDDGDDVLTGDVLELHGGDGDDLLVGGSGNNLFFGGAGEDTMVGNGGSDTFDGGPEFDTILIRGTSFADRIDLRQDSPEQLRYEIGNPANLFDGVLGGPGTVTSALVLATVEQVRIEAGAGDDIIRVAHDDSLVAAGIAANMLRIDVRGGAPGASDRLTVVDDGPGDTTVQRIGGTPGEGTFTMYSFSGGNPADPIIPLPPVVYTEVEYASLHPISPVSGGTGADGNGRLFVFKHDPFEQNQSRVNATFLGANQTTNVDPVIDPGSDVPFGTPGDEDWYRIVAEVTGTLDIQVYFRQQGTLANGRAGLPGDGNLEIALYDADGLVNGVEAPIAGTGAFGTNDTDDDERIRIPAVAGQTYYLRVVGAPLPAGDNLNASSAINIYNVSVVNHAPPVPFDLELADSLTILTGGQEVPAVATIATGTANFQYNAVANTFDLDLFVSGIELTDLTALPELTGAHIHVGAVGVNGPIIVNLGIVGWQVEPAGIRLQLAAQPFPAANIADLLAGNTYINVHSTVNLGGEIRGQILIQNVLGVSDSGRSQFDNVTRDNTPTILLRLDDAILLNDLPGNAAGVPGAPPPDGVPIEIPFNPSTAASPVGLNPGYRVAIYDEIDMHNPVFLGFAQQVPNLNGVYSFTFVTPLSDGSHFITARVQMIDPADNDVNNATLTRATGFGPRSQSLEIVVDTTPPPVFFGFANDPNDGLVPDPGVIPQPPFFVDNKTADQTPAFWGTAEANAIVRVYADLTPDNGVDNFDVLLGMTVALPFDGTNQYPNGQWRVSSNIDLNDPAFFPLDGLRRILVTAEDLAGNVNPGPGLSAQAQALGIFLDTQGPQVTGVFATNLLGLLPGNTLLRFNAASPSSIAATLPITGLLAGDTVVGIDLRPANGLVYAVADGPNPDALYTINPLTGAATFVANLSVALSGTTFGVDFDPVTDTLRIVSDADINYSVNPLTGAVTAQAALNPGNPNIAGTAYTNNNAGALFTSLYTIDFGADVLNVQNPAAGGTQTVVGPLGINASALLGFDVAPVNNIAFAAMTNTVNGRTGLYTIDLTTGEAMLLGDIRDGLTSLLGLTAISEYDIFDPKPSTDGPTPLLTKLFIRVQDLPGREDPFDNPAINPAVAIAVGHYRLVGDANGIIPIQSVQFIPDPFVPGQPAGGTIVLMFFAPLPDDRFTLILSDSLVDDVGNALDGESNAAEPQGNPQFPTGDGQPGGSFVARFTVDSRPELGVYHSGSVWVDTNGNFTFDPHNLDYTNRDIVYVLGYTTDNLFAGNFSPPGPNSIADGFDKLAAYGRVGNNFRWLIDTDNDGVPNPPTGIIEPLGVTGMPVAGNFDGNAINGDEVGLFSGNTWYFDTTHNYQLDTILSTPNMSGIPIVGDFNGDGADDLGVWKDDRFTFLFTTGGVPRSWVPGTEVTYDFGFIGVREKPLATDMDRDGIDDIGLWVPDRAGVAPEGNGEWYFLISAGVPWPQRIAAENGRAQFTPVPFGNDMYASFGDEFAVPVVGNFDPPLTPPSSNLTSIGLTNLDNRFDVNGDGIVNALDALIQINDANTNGQRTIGLGQLGGPYLDVNGDGWISPADVLATVNYLNSQVAGGEGEGAQAGDWAATVVVSPVATLNSVAVDSLAGIPYAGSLSDAAPRSGAVRSVAAQVDQIFADDDEADDLSVYAGDLADAVLAGTGREIRPSGGNAVAELASDDLLAELAADQGRPQESSADGFFAKIGRLFPRLG